MSSSPPPQGHFLLATTPDFFYVRVVGLATMANCTGLPEVLEDGRRQGCRQFVFDLAPCSGFDSTFMGILLGIAHGPPEGGPGKPDPSVIVINAGAEHRRLLGEVGLNRVVRLVSKPIEFPPLELRKVEERPGSARRRLHSILLAHENLVRLGGTNVEKFGAILETLKRELAEDRSLD